MHQNVKLPSDHAPICIKLSLMDAPYEYGLQRLVARASALSEIDVKMAERVAQRRAIRMYEIDREAASAALADIVPPVLTPFDPDAVAEHVNHILYTSASGAQREAQRRNAGDGNQGQSARWAALVESNDHRTLWKAISWNGAIDNNGLEGTPSDSAFKDHFEQLLNPGDEPPFSMPPETDLNMYVPVTDDPIQVREVEEAVQSLKADKSGGPSGVPPGIIKLLPACWIAFITAFFTQLLIGHLYPCVWRLTKLVTLFKKGARDLCGNYRGISLMDSMAKLYDIVLNHRLSRWWKPEREQAGSQKGRGCLEHIITLRLLIDYAKNKRQKLYIVYVDFSKAYDRVPRNLLLHKLAQLGCGNNMLNAIASIYQGTRMVLRTAIITASVGVRQGSPTSCLLFVLVVNELIQKLKQCAPDGFLGWLHSLMMMDDTIILATTRERALEKIRILTEFCASSGMLINNDKTQFMVINGADGDRAPLVDGDLTIKNCMSYTYLGSVFTQDGSISSAVEAHCRAKTCHVLKFEAFVRKNTEMPFAVKLRVFEAALMTAILYASESWLSASALTPAASMYMGCVKQLLGVRRTTANDLCLVEIGLPSLIERVRESQRRAISKLLQAREGMLDDPFMHVWTLVSGANIPCVRYMNRLQEFDGHAEMDRRLARVREQAAVRSKLQMIVT